MKAIPYNKDLCLKPRKWEATSNGTKTYERHSRSWSESYGKVVKPQYHVAWQLLLLLKGVDRPESYKKGVVPQQLRASLSTVGSKAYVRGKI